MRKENIFLSQQIHRRNKILNRSNKRLARSTRERVRLDAHEHHRLRASFVCLWQMDVHFVAVEIGVVRSADAFVETESFPRHNFDLMTHHRLAMKGRLTVEKDDIAVVQMSLKC